jgi:nitrite reductase/ring-hydroxylating ferredoxin subunit
MTQTVAPLSKQEKIQRGAEDAGHYFRYMSEFIGFTEEDAKAIRETGLVIEKYIPEIVAQFYTHLLRYLPTRKHFLRADGTVDQDYLQLRMHHLTNFWRKTASGVYDDDYARYIDYVGRAHTSHGADPNIYIAERYVIGQVGFVQHAISQALTKELHEIDPELETRALRSWNLLMMVILEMLARVYSADLEVEGAGARPQINHEAVFNMAVETYELGLGLRRSTGIQDVLIGRADEIADGERKIVQVGDISIGVFHHQGQWYALQNSCLHRGGPVCTGMLEGDILICPWHGYQYDVKNGQLLEDPSAKLATFRVEVREGELHLQVPLIHREKATLPLINTPQEPDGAAQLGESEFYLRDVSPGYIRLVHLSGEPVAVYNLNGEFYATHNACTHAGGPLNEGTLSGKQIICPWHASCFDVTDGQVLCGPAAHPVKPYHVVIDGEIGRVEVQDGAK